MKVKIGAKIGLVITVVLFCCFVLHGEGLETLSKLSYDGTQESYQKIQDAAMSAAKKGNGVAINICRQSMYALGQEMALKKGPIQAKGAKTLDKEQIEKWLALVHSKAKNGDLFFINVLALHYYYGKYGVEKNKKKAIALWKKASGKDFPLAYFHLGFNMQQNYEIQKNAKKMMEYYKQGAALDDVYCTYNLGAIYFSRTNQEFSRVITKDNKKAFNYFLQASEKGHPSAQHNLAVCYLKGLGVDKDSEKAEYWFRKALKNGEESALEWIDRHFGGATKKKKRK